MQVTVHPSTIDGAVAAPPSKSVMLRALAAALLAGESPTRIGNPSLCDDARSGFEVARALGAEIEVSADEVRVWGGLAARSPELPCGESGLCLRMFTALAGLLPGERALTGTGTLLGRPVTSVEAALRSLGAECRTRGGFPPVVVRGPLRGGEARVDGAVSSQFLSGLLLALPHVDRDSTVVVPRLASRPYVDLTLDLLDRFGVRIDREGYRRFHVPGGQRLVVGEFRVEGDWSAAAFLLVLGALAGRVAVRGLDPRSLQPDRRILDVLEAVGAEVHRKPDGAEVQRAGLRPFEFDATDAPDLLLPLAALAVRAEGTSAILGVERLRTKESNRVELLAREFTGLGIRVAVGADRLEITGGQPGGGRGRAHGDHRMAMALALTALAGSEPVAIDGADHVAKSYPGFFADVVAMGGDVRDSSGRPWRPTALRPSLAPALPPAGREG